jgi:predicted methyltransferase
MPRLTELAHHAVRAVLGPGDVAVDATAGNGHDTRFLCDLVGPTGHVFAFDVQPSALENAARMVEGASHVVLLQRDHAEMHDAIPPRFHGQVAAVMLNLGYLPGGDKSIVTRTESTLTAIRAALRLLRPGGVLTVIAYPGHPGGREEAAAVAMLLNSPGIADDNPASPRLFVLHSPALSTID